MIRVGLGIRGTDSTGYDVYVEDYCDGSIVLAESSTRAEAEYMRTVLMSALGLVGTQIIPARSEQA